MQRNQIIIAVGLVLITIATFFPVGGLGFIGYDDPSYVTANPLVQRGFTREGLVWAFTELHGAQTYYHPVTWLTHMLDCQLFGLNPRGHHLVSLGFHIVNVLLLFSLFTQCIGAAPGKDARGSPSPSGAASADVAAQPPYLLWASALIAALFAVHPLQVESVAWVTERKNLVSTCFGLLTLLAYLHYTKRRSAGWYVATMLSFILALLSKPAVVTIPCLMLLLDYWPLRRMHIFDDAGRFAAKGSVKARSLLLEKLPFFALSIASSIVTIEAHRGLGLIGAETSPPIGLKYGNVLLAYAEYIRTFLFPVRLAIFYPFRMSISSASIGIALLVLALITGAAVLWAKRRPYVLVGWLWFVGAMVPMSGIVSVGIQARADRFMYLPIIGLAMMIAFVLAEWLRAKPKIFLTCAPLAVLLCVTLSLAQLRYWKDNFTLFDHARRVTKDNFMAYQVIGETLGQRGAFAEALTNLQAAVQMQPMFAPAYVGLGKVKLALGRPAEAINDFEEALRRGGPWNPEARLGLAKAYRQMGNPQAAITSFQEVLRLKPDTAEAHRELADLFLARGQFKAAIGHFRESLAFEPNSDHALAGLAFLLATHGDPQIRNGPQAVDLARRACTLTGYAQAGPLNALAAAYAEVGNFELATNTVQKALDLARAKNQLNMIPTTETFFKTYQSGKPYRISND